MKAAVYYKTGGPEVLRYEEVADPVLRKGGILIDVVAIGIQGDSGRQHRFDEGRGQV